MTIILGGGDFPSFLEALGAPSDSMPVEARAPVIGDISFLAERAKERRTRHVFEPGQFVHVRAPDGLGMNWVHGHFVVVQILEEIVRIERVKDGWENSVFPYSESDIVVGFMMPTSTGQRVYREMLTWSGFFVPYDLTPMEREMESIGLEEAEKVQKTADPKLSEPVEDQKTEAFVNTKPSLWTRDP